MDTPADADGGLLFIEICFPGSKIRSGGRVNCGDGVLGTYSDGNLPP